MNWETALHMLAVEGNLSYVWMESWLMMLFVNVFTCFSCSSSITCFKTFHHQTRDSDLSSVWSELLIWLTVLRGRAAINLTLIQSDCGTLNVSQWRLSNPYSSMKPLISLIGMINHLIYAVYLSLNGITSALRTVTGSCSWVWGPVPVPEEMDQSSRAQCKIKNRSPICKIPI